MERPLDGIRVLEVAQWWFVPSAGAILADWGAEVIKIEHPETGDPQRGLITSGLVPQGGFNFMWEQPNRGKKSVALDIRKETGRDLLYKLAERSDVFLTSFLPEARRKLAIDVEHIRRVNPRIIYARGSGQGVRGPDAERGGYDAASYWARGGIAGAISGAGSDEPPVSQRPAFGDSLGGMTIAGGIGTALFRRERTGVASVIDISLLGTAMWNISADITMARALAALGLGKGMPKFSRTMSPNPIVNAYQTKDKRWIMLVMLQSDRNWPDLCRHLGRPELIDDPRFVNAAARAANKVECVTDPGRDLRRARPRDLEEEARHGRRRVGADAVPGRAVRRPAGDRQRLPARGGARERRDLPAGGRAGAVRRAGAEDRGRTRARTAHRGGAARARASTGTTSRARRRAARSCRRAGERARAANAAAA